MNMRDFRKFMGYVYYEKKLCINFNFFCTKIKLSDSLFHELFEIPLSLFKSVDAFVLCKIPFSSLFMNNVMFVFCFYQGYDLWSLFTEVFMWNESFSASLKNFYFLFQEIIS